MDELQQRQAGSESWWYVEWSDMSECGLLFIWTFTI